MNQSSPNQSSPNDRSLLLALDTCGPVCSIALGRAENAHLDIVGESSLPGGELSVSLAPAIADLLSAAHTTMDDLSGLVVVAGPGSFTGIRIGLALAKGLAEARNLPIVTVSRLALLSRIAGTPTAVLDAHRGQIYCGIYSQQPEREMLLTAGEVNAMGGLPGPVGVCEEAVAQFLEDLQGEPEFVRVAAPTAADTLRFALPRWQAKDFADAGSLDGYYLRGADAKISARLG